MPNSIIRSGKFRKFKRLPQVILVLILANSYVSVAVGWDCVYVSSYHRGYAWSDGIERGLRKELGEKCNLTQFNMDTKRNKDESYKINISREIAKKIKKINPDVLMISDDNAAKYLVVPHFRGGQLPVVFSGINWTVKEYGFPDSNVTGMIEVAPIRPMLKWAMKLSSQGKKGLYIGADTLTESKDLIQVRKVATELGVEIESILADTLDDWMKAFQGIDDIDFIILGSTSGVKGWDDALARSFLKESPAKLILTNYRWMMPYAMLGFVEIPEEHGQWLAKTAISIQGGLQIQRIPIIASRKWEVYENSEMIKRAGMILPTILRTRAKKINQEPNDGRY